MATKQSSSSKIMVPQARAAMNKFKMEAANEVGVDLKKGYNGSMTTREAGSIASQWLSWPTTTEGYTWSNDNLAEIEKGWIIKADTIEELAEKIGRDPVELQATIDRYNEMCEKGVDEDFGRDPATMAPIEKAPFYAVSITPTLVATTGGAKRDTDGRVLDWNENPIPGLYEAGELGSYVSNLYQNGVFLSEAMLSGRTAASKAHQTRVPKGRF